MRFTVIGVVIDGIAGLFAYAGGWLTPHALTPASMINTFEKVNGRKCCKDLILLKISSFAENRLV